MATPFFVETVPGQVHCRLARRMVTYDPSVVGDKKKAYEVATNLENAAIDAVEERLGRPLSLREYLAGEVAKPDTRSLRDRIGSALDRQNKTSQSKFAGE